MPWTSHCRHGHPRDAANLAIDKDGHPHCRACDRERRRARYVSTGRPPGGCRPATPAELRFARLVDLCGTVPAHRPELGQCRLWTGTKNADGYGRFRLRTGVMVSAHVFSFESVNGPVPDGLELDHLCRNRPCVSDAHLEAVTHQENVRRGRLGEVTRLRHAEARRLVG